MQKKYYGEVDNIYTTIESYGVVHFPINTAQIALHKLDSIWPEEVNTRTSVRFARSKADGTIRKKGHYTSGPEWVDLPCTFHNDILRFVECKEYAPCRLTFYSYRMRRNINVTLRDFDKEIARTMRMGYLVGRFLRKSSGGYHVLEPLVG